MEMLMSASDKNAEEQVLYSYNHFHLPIIFYIFSFYTQSFPSSSSFLISRAYFCILYLSDFQKRLDTYNRYSLFKLLSLPLDLYQTHPINKENVEKL